ncbi:MAG TPA: carbohydrate kinase family protein [Mycobacteriales bacterium]|nr:carbohydrate kinase family protein [Mycobacteriales bacterium]
MQASVVVVGVTSLTVAIPVEGFPVEYQPESFPAWARAGLGGVGAQVSRILRTLGNQVSLCTVVGADTIGRTLRAELRACGLHGPGVLPAPESSLGVALVAPDGRRRGHPYLGAVAVAEYPPETFLRSAAGADLAVLTNVGLARPLLPFARELGVPVAVDVHVIADVDDPYNRPWLDVADVVFCSHERLPCSPSEWVGQVLGRYPGCAIAAVGCGGAGSVLGLRDGTLVTVPAAAPRGVRNTLGAGDALFASFLHGWLATGNPIEALTSATVYAGWKVGGSHPSQGFPEPEEFDRLRAANPVRARVTRWR